MKNDSSASGNTSNHPSEWNLDQFRANWFTFFESIIKDSSLIPSLRMRYQIEQTDVFREVVSGWEKMDGAQRLDAWKRLLLCAEESSREMLPACVQCGECCRKGSPALHAEDIEILRSGKIPWNQLITLRKGEPALSPFDGRPFVLPEERIKILEKEGSKECVFLEGNGDRCAIYDDRPVQCRAQACWDPVPAQELSSQPFMLREHIFEDIGLLLEIIAEHENRCGVGALSAAFEKLHKGEGENIEEVIQLLSFEEHFRNFVSEKFTIPPENLELLLGKSFADMLPVYGYKIKIEPDGSRCLVPDTEVTGNYLYQVAVKTLRSRSC